MLFDEKDMRSVEPSITGVRDVVAREKARRIDRAGSSERSWSITKIDETKPADPSNGAFCLSELKSHDTLVRLTSADCG